MSGFINENQWLIGLIAGFVLNQLAVSIDRIRKRKDVKLSFEKHILFIKGRLYYISEDLNNLPYTVMMSEDHKISYAQNLENLKNDIINIDKDSIPNVLKEEVASLANDLSFFASIVRGNKEGKAMFEGDDSVRVAVEIAEDQRLCVEKIFKFLNIKFE